jgi:hypothetical protein
MSENLEANRCEEQIIIGYYGEKKTAVLLLAP